jgi:hypothetical protein
VSLPYPYNLVDAFTARTYLSTDASDRAERRTSPAATAVSAPAPTQRYLSPDARDRAEGRTTPDVIVVSAATPAAAPSTATGGGIDWTDAGLGAGCVLGLTLISIGGALVAVRRHGTRGLAS